MGGVFLETICSKSLMSYRYCRLPRITTGRSPFLVSSYTRARLIDRNSAASAGLSSLFNESIELHVLLSDLELIVA